MGRKLIVTALIVFGLAGMFFYFRWSSAIRQPLNFSHAQHVRSKIECAQCHKTGELDSLPAPASCASCHADMRLPEKVQWARIYRVAPDIIFSHSSHLKISCATCHDQVVAGRRWIHESRFTMDFCMKCHQQMRADNSCGACHKNR